MRIGKRRHHHRGGLNAERKGGLKLLRDDNSTSRPRLPPRRRAGFLGLTISSSAREVTVVSRAIKSRFFYLLCPCLLLLSHPYPSFLYLFSLLVLLSFSPPFSHLPFRSLSKNTPENGYMGFYSYKESTQRIASAVRRNDFSETT